MIRRFRAEAAALLTGKEPSPDLESSPDAGTSSK